MKVEEHPKMFVEILRNSNKVMILRIDALLVRNPSGPMKVTESLAAWQLSVDSL